MTALRNQLAASLALLDNGPLLAVRRRIDALRLDYVKQAQEASKAEQFNFASYWRERATAMADVIRLIDETLMEDEK